MHGSADEESVWGIGHVGAIFAWAPVLVDMAYKSKILWSRQIDHNQFTSTHDVNESREDSYRLETRGRF